MDIFNNTLLQLWVLSLPSGSCYCYLFICLVLAELFYCSQFYPHSGKPLVLLLRAAQPWVCL